ncbi:arginyl-tRNA synthetase [Evansella vedderi]|uniref:Arginine--tRNA ligase n=1 Tax=Evansella vedderi TaxID=38282 RepID=A0ABT9ZXY3_9BACI|nr:arginine--tRNA ligase [Evansella vedderi]MDQ0256102.1 arginyl-tRNA synthetase [Evansella vedderi]
MNLKAVFSSALMSILEEKTMTVDEVEKLIESPKYENHGDLAFPCFILAKQLRKTPQQIAIELAEKLNDSLVEKAEAVGPYMNVFFNKKEVSKHLLQKICHEQDNYGARLASNRGKVVIDFSSPNIAKPFSMGHLRSTVIGHSLAKIAEKNGYTAIKINHLGDWGTQFGKLITAYKHWGNELEVKENTIPTLLKLYIQFHAEAENNPSLEEEGRTWFQRLEGGDTEALSLWNWFKNESLKEFEKVYKMLGVSFDAVQGESFYNGAPMEEIVKELEDRLLLKESDGARVVKMGEELPPCLIQKTDGTTLYATRDLAAAIYRKNQYNFVKCLYVVGGEQQLHFQQVFHVLSKMGHDWEKDLVHVPFGLILKDGKKMSTRKGKIVLLEEVLDGAIKKAKENIMKKNPNLQGVDEVAREVGVGAVIFHDLKNERMGNVEFNLDQMLTFEGETGPYVQYTIARGNTILEKEASSFGEISGLGDEVSWQIMKLLEQFPREVVRAYETYEPSVIAKYTVRLAQAFNSYYGKVRILSDDSEQESRLALTYAVTTVLKEGLRLLGIQSPEKM